MRFKNSKSAVKSALSFASCQDQVVCNAILHCDSQKTRKSYKNKWTEFCKNIKYLKESVYNQKSLKCLTALEFFWNFSKMRLKKTIT